MSRIGLKQEENMIFKSREKYDIAFLYKFLCIITTTNDTYF